jgi:hypothetical protein
MKTSRINYIVMWIVWVALAMPVCGEDVLPTLSFDDEEPEAVAAPSVPTPAAAPVAAVAAPVAEVEAGLDLDTVRANAIAFFRGRAADEKADGLIAPPVRHSVVIGKTKVDARFSNKLVDVNVFENVQEYRNVKVGDSTDAVMVRKKVNVQKKVGTKKEMRLVRDPNGDIIRQVDKAEYGPGGPDEWTGFLFGNNAMAIYAMMRAGVDAQDEVVQRVAQQLSDIYDQHGLPDLTWDLAWSTAAFSQMNEPHYRELAGQMAGKLLDGQIADGAASGLWGPVCVNTELLAAMTKKKADYSAFYLKAKAKHAATPRDSYQEKAEQALEALRSFEGLIQRVSMLADKMTYVSLAVILADEMGMAHPIRVPALSSWIFNQRSADMESTAVAMFGLRVAAEQKLIPKETWRPMDERKRPLVAPRRASDVLSRAIKAMTAAQKREGWTELNQHQPVTDFDTIGGINGVPVDKRSFKPLASPMTKVSTVQGYAVFSYYAAIYGVSGIRPFARNVVAGNASVKSVLAALEKPDRKKAPACDLCFFVSETPDLGKAEYDLNAWATISAYLVDSQNEDGSWGIRLPECYFKVPPSLRERRNVLPGMFWDKTEVTRDWSKAHADMNSKDWNHTIRCLYQQDPLIVDTAYALLALAGEKDKSGIKK